MKVVFRADASLQIGSGHIMRCLTLADALRRDGAECRFISRNHIGNLNDQIRHKGYEVDVLDRAAVVSHTTEDGPPHAAWLGASTAQDAAQCLPLLQHSAPDWLVVDHYGLDIGWENRVAGEYRKLMVIDDLADRKHRCDLLLDQTLGRARSDYETLTPGQCERLCGPYYSLLRPEFAAARDASLARRANPSLNHVLVSMGGVDKDNATGTALEAIRGSSLSSDCRVTIVLGANAPWLDEVQRLARTIDRPAEVRIGVDDMAALMAQCDLAIGAAGTTSWERCALGLPTIMLILADNQRYIADNLDDYGAALVSDGDSDHIRRAIDRVAGDMALLSSLSAKAATVTDGLGAGRVAARVTDLLSA